ncbi:MAG: hypothetical protein ACLR8U_14200 [Oscillospiraceae bacterium]
MAKGETVWGMGVKQGTTLYLCLEDSTLRIQNRLFEDHGGRSHQCPLLHATATPLARAWRSSSAHSS